LELIPEFGSQPAGDLVIIINPGKGCLQPAGDLVIIINPGKGCLYFLPGLQLLSKPKSITAA